MDNRDDPKKYEGRGIAGFSAFKHVYSIWAIIIAKCQDCMATCAPTVY